MRQKTERKQRNVHSQLNDSSSQDLLLEAASELMIERGTTDISLSDISIRSGVNAALVRYYFGSKHGLMMALVRKALAPSLLQIDHLIDMKISPKEKMRIHISGIVNTYYTYPYINRLMHQLITEDYEIYGPIIVNEVSAPVSHMQKLVLEEGVSAGIFRRVDPTLVYLQIVGACDQFFHGRIQRKTIFNIDEVDEDYKKKFADLLFDSIMKGLSSK